MRHFRGELEAATGQDIVALPTRQSAWFGRVQQKSFALRHILEPENYIRKSGATLANFVPTV